MQEGAVLIKSVVLAKNNKIESAVQLLKEFSSKNVKDQLKAKLTAVQLLLSQVMLYLQNISLRNKLTRYHNILLYLICSFSSYERFINDEIKSLN